MLKAFICGGSGYTGSELLRILAGHDEVEIVGVTSEKSAGMSVSELFPAFFIYKNLKFENLHIEKIKDRADIYFLALPHGKSQEVGALLVGANKRVIDLSADFRIKDAKVYEQWYKTPHSCSDLLKEAVYGLPEIYRDKIKKARLIANPGCYPTSAILPLYPFLKKELINIDTIVVDSKSGTSGAGRKAEVTLSYCEVNEDFRAYNVAKHRHTPEIEQELSYASGRDITIDFTTHLLPLNRGILSTIYGKLNKNMTTKEAIEVLEESYQNEPFVKIMPEGQIPAIKYVRGTNYCYIGVVVNQRTGRIILISAIDNLVKGASGQAVQNMNIMFGIDETKALKNLALSP
ncbi:N-acetyl-gamma-glutamyl-phosphate reductase [Thermodesulfovibrio yellowstonii]|uniref:N-acetyl-gamma-glutamyl-phosphate reductase n=1 Tax=Thermodesulfovibrio yellowstonii TaxID=28262 RepID=A0A9W6GFQ3_9BACT|nr:MULTISPECIES: N-acetyl-gamma-glutamyl-phosphate reductase [Thermodesulfovibrio]MDI6865534.1 N-acetyl-gamma-glutamyl-phosphate reductase [Thermodesulfovibrio yellowstonii]GLI53032.1 N-acetyl-gamma-glutamyl-phosphate reductase [Thermodesulfovibrio islandicus]